MKKKNTKPLWFLGFVSLILFIVGMTYFWYGYFKDDAKMLAKLEIILQDEMEGLKITNSLPITDDKINSISPYTFSVTNTGSLEGSYQLLIEETTFNQIHDGCTLENQLTREQLKYEIRINGKVVTMGKLSDVKNNILDDRTILPMTSNNYELRIWIPEQFNGNEDWIHKHYHYHVTVKPISGEGVK